MKYAAATLFFVFSVLFSCAPSPCDELADEWKDCWCGGVQPGTTLPQQSIDEACESRESFVNSGYTIPDAERAAINRCSEEDARWASRRMEASECREGGSYVCGGDRADTVCMPPENAS